MSKANLSDAYRAAIAARPIEVDAERLARVLGGAGERSQREEDLSAALADPAFALRVGAALRSDAEALSLDLRAAAAPVRRQPTRRALPFGWAVAASMVLAALFGLAMQPMQLQAPDALATASDLSSSDLISSVSFEKSERSTASGDPQGSIFVDRFGS
jgi:hypothetical protein